jgi:hypothetical protein
MGKNTDGSLVPRYRARGRLTVKNFDDETIEPRIRIGLVHDDWRRAFRRLQNVMVLFGIIALVSSATQIIIPFMEFLPPYKPFIQGILAAISAVFYALLTMFQVQQGQAGFLAAWRYLARAILEYDSAVRERPSDESVFAKTLIEEYYKSEGMIGTMTIDTNPDRIHQMTRKLQSE